MPNSEFLIVFFFLADNSKKYLLKCNKFEMYQKLSCILKNPFQCDSISIINNVSYNMLHNLGSFRRKKISFAPNLHS